MQGTVKWFNDEKGYGFIRAVQGGREIDVFVHHSQILMNGRRFLEEGQAVDFDLVSSPKGWAAESVSLA